MDEGLRVGDLLAALKRLIVAREGFPRGWEIRDVKEILENPHIPDGRIRGIFLRHRRGAESLLRRVLETYPEDMNAFSYLVHLLEAEGRYGEADEEFRKMAEAFPLDPWIRLGYALFLEEWGRRGEAEAQHRKAIELEPNEPLYRIEYARFLDKAGDRRARKVYKSALAILPPGSEVRSLLKKKLRGDEGPWNLWYEPPSAGTLGRFMRQYHKEISNLFKRLNMVEAVNLLVEMPPPPESPFLKRARETSRYKEALLEVDASKDRVEVDDPEDWAHLEALGILNSWKPGFELYLNELFFDERCRKCRRKRRVELRCREGLSNCIFDDEFDEFERERVQEIIKKLRAGIEPKKIRELQVPRFLKKIETKIRLHRKPKKK